MVLSAYKLYKLTNISKDMVLYNYSLDTFFIKYCSQKANITKTPKASKMNDMVTNTNTQPHQETNNVKLDNRQFQQVINLVI